MLPFLKPRKDNDGVLVKYRASDETSDRKPEELHPALMAGAEDLARAISQGDKRHIALAFQALFQICDSMPHEEGPHTEESSNEEQ